MRNLLLIISFFVSSLSLAGEFNIVPGMYATDDAEIIVSETAINGIVEISIVQSFGSSNLNVFLRRSAVATLGGNPGHVTKQWQKRISFFFSNKFKTAFFLPYNLNRELTLAEVNNNPNDGLNHTRGVTPEMAAGLRGEIETLTSNNEWYKIDPKENFINYVSKLREIVGGNVWALDQAERNAWMRSGELTENADEKTISFLVGGPMHNRTRSLSITTNSFGHLKGISYRDKEALFLGEVGFLKLLKLTNRQFNVTNCERLLEP